MFFLLLLLQLFSLLIFPLRADEIAKKAPSTEEKKETPTRKIKKSKPQADGVFFGMKNGPLSEYLAGYEYLDETGRKRFVKTSLHVNKISTDSEAQTYGVGLGWGVKF